MPIDPSSILLTDRVAIVTGGGSGIGRGIARGFAAFGAKVAIWERHADTAAAAAEEVGGLGITIDVREPAEVDAALERTVAELGPVSILVNNAGGVFFSPLLETSENGWDALYRSNLKHVILCTQRVARGMVEHGIGGSIISVTSIEGVRAAPGYAAYAAAKAGVINYTKTAALELAPLGIRVNALAPDITMTEGIAAVAPRGARRGSASPCPWAGPATWTRWPAQPCSWPVSSPATSPARRSTSTAARTRRAGGITTRRQASTSSGRGNDPPGLAQSSSPPRPTWADIPPSTAIICPVM